MNEIKLIEVKKEEIPMHLVIYGLAGCGKTHLAGQFPKPMAVLELDNKYHPMIGQGDIDIFQFLMAKPEDARLAIPQLWQKWQSLKNDEHYKTIVLDSITALDRILERYALLMAGKQAAEKSTLPIYGDMKRWYSTFFPSLRAATDKNIVLLAHEQSKEDAEGKLLSIRPYITGKMGDQLASIFDHTFHMEYIPGTQERWELRYRKQGLYVASSSIFSGGTGVVSYTRNENGYEKLVELMKSETK